MLAAYYGKQCDSAELFAPYKLAKCDSYRKYLNQYNVIVLNIQNFLSVTNSVDEMLTFLQKRVISELRRQYPDTNEASAVEKQILATVKVKKTSATITEGKKLTVQMSKKLDMDNVAKITYSTSKKSVAAVSKNGQITGKNTGSADITAKVILNNGKTKTVKMRITVR